MPARFIVLLLMAGCASDVTRTPAELSASGQLRGYVAAQTAAIRLDSGYERTVAKGTQFVEVGTIPKGRVLKPVDSVFTVEGAHMHEAYLVLDGQRIVGFYLPVERAFSPLSYPVNLPLEERKP